jgi:hypothetical protein
MTYQATQPIDMHGDSHSRALKIRVESYSRPVLNKCFDLHLDDLIQDCSILEFLASVRLWRLSWE